MWPTASAPSVPHRILACFIRAPITDSHADSTRPDPISQPFTRHVE
ncbi:MAG: hypothetical protein JWO38_2796 [Gemmataceae bacterium]|nr:hypothetical protein [Gemmataceae bacterium]